MSGSSGSPSVVLSRIALVLRLAAPSLKAVYDNFVSVAPAFIRNVAAVS